MEMCPDLFAAEPIPESAMEDIKALMQSGDLFRYTSGTSSPVAQLERDFADLMGTPYALAVNSCSSGIFLTIKAMGLKPGSRILMPAFTFAAVPSAVVHADCQPVLVECGADFRIDMADFGRKLDRTISAVLISHMRGHTSDMDCIMDLCAARGVPVIEDAAHSLGTTWAGRKIGTLGKVGCFSLQSYKLLNAGEGGLLITSDEDIIARAIIMSGAYEHNWQKHGTLSPRIALWQNKLPLYNMRMNNLSAVVARCQLAELPRRVEYGRRNHDHVAAKLEASPWFSVPDPLDAEVRAPDSIQFRLRGFDSHAAVQGFISRAAERGLDVQIFGLSRNNARAFWNWEFIGPQGDLPKTRDMLMRTCDVRLPARLEIADLDIIADILLSSAEDIQGKVPQGPAFTTSKKKASASKI